MIKKLRRPKITIEAILWIAVLAFIGYRMWPQAAAALGFGAAGTEAPDLHVETLSDESLTLEDFRGEVVLVNFWATWCPPCRWEMPGFQRVYETYQDEGFTILGLSTDQTGRGPVQDFLDEYGITYPVAMSPPGAVHAFGGGNTLPTSFLIDREGQIRHTVRGYFSETALEKAVKRLLDEEDMAMHPRESVEPTSTGPILDAREHEVAR